MSQSENGRPAPGGVFTAEEPLLVTEAKSSGAIVVREGSDEDPEPVSDQTHPKEKEDVTKKEIEALGPQKKTDDQFSDSEYSQFSNKSEKAGETSDTPFCHWVKTTDSEKQACTQAQSETRHYKISAAGDSSKESSVDENFDVASLAEAEVENVTWRGRMQHVLHNHWFHLIIALLVSLDALIVVFELLIDVGAFNNVRCEGTNFQEQAEECHYTNHNECFPMAKMILEGVNISASPTDTGRNSELCRCGFRQGRRVCINSVDHIGVNPGFVLHIFSILILSTFLVEIALKMIAFRVKYFTHKFEVFDGVIVVISWILDVASIERDSLPTKGTLLDLFLIAIVLQEVDSLSTKDKMVDSKVSIIQSSQEEAFEAASLIIVLRLWRVIRIVNGAVISSKAQSDLDLEKSRNEARKLIHALHKAQDRMNQLEDKNADLMKKLKH